MRPEPAGPVHLRPPAAIVLAGGESSRFGGNKLAAVVRGRPLLHHAIAAVAGLADPVVLVLAPDAPVPLLPPGPGALVVARDAVAHRGPLAGLAAGLAALDPAVDRAIVVAGDMPSLVPAVLALLLDALDGDAALGAVHLEAEPPAPLPAALRPAIVRAVAESLLAADRRSLGALLASVPVFTVPAVDWRALDPAAETLRDVDTRRDLADR